ncbi:MAG: glycerol-3-phosphate 1-O-acyltransferase PlsY [Planctomycetota bacterium]
MADPLTISVTVFSAYMVGAIPFGYLIARAKGVDIREHGSGNIGATNVLRVLGKGPGIACFALDVLKGALPVVAGGIALGVFGTHDLSPGAAAVWLWVAITTVVGHMFPVYLNFKGGKGVATGFGALAAMWPIVTPAPLIALALWFLTLRVTRYVSVASCVAAVSLCVSLAALRLAGWGRPEGVDALTHTLDGWVPILAMALIGGLVVYRHTGNLSRVMRGEEPKVGGKKPDACGAG